MAGEFTSSVNTTVKLGTLTIGGTVQAILGDQLIDVSKILPTVSTDVEIDLAIDVSAVQLMALETDQDATVKTNSTSAPDDTLALKAKQPLIWTKDQPTAIRFFSADVTKLYVTTTVAQTAIKFGALLSIVPSLP